MDAIQISQNYQRVIEQIERAARSAGRSPQEVRLVVVTKTHPVETIRYVVQAGVKYLGESYADEGASKILALSGLSGVEWHMIGHVQSRKARPVCEHFNYLHSLDSRKLANRLDSFCSEIRSAPLPALLECNVSGEESKFGLPAWQEGAWEGLLPEVEDILALPHLAVKGLMTIAPYSDDPEQARPVFQKLRRLRDYFAARFPAAHWGELSMGMSGDFEAAIQEGATWVRVGTAILGPREYT